MLVPKVSLILFILHGQIFVCGITEANKRLAQGSGYVTSCDIFLLMGSVMSACHGANVIIL